MNFHLISLEMTLSAKSWQGPKEEDCALFPGVETLPGICSERGMTACANAYRQVGRGMANLRALALSAESS